LLVFLVTANFASFQTGGAAPSTSPVEVINWNGIALRTVTGLSPGQGFVAIAYAQAAVYNAVVAIQGGYHPYLLELAPNPDASINAAVAAAAFHVLDHYFPAQHAALATDYAVSLAAVPDGSAKDMGIALGTDAAAGIIDLRKDDGYAVNIGFVMPSPGPGVWQLPTGVSPLTPWLSQMQPFLLQSPDQFRPGPPPDLTSSAWAVEFNETKTMGKLNSQYRTQEQTDIARFWTSYPPFQYNTAFRTLILAHELDAMQAARLFAMGNMVGSDALIACFDAKYHYLFWRPIFSIPQADTDGNPLTESDPTWAALLGTPPHPEYPSAHGCLTKSIAETLAEFLGTNKINVDIPSTVPGLFPDGRSYESVNDLTQEIIDARVWGGIHYRESDIKGVTLKGTMDLKRYFYQIIDENPQREVRWDCTSILTG
jgi:hypothetical protein